ncbi:MAG: CsbD family protein [Actinomycetota bacterium]|nr:CsbD family protein [Actinomycetota bacterium]
MADRSEQLGGKIKEGVGKVTGDEALESQGRREDHREQTKQNIDETKDKVAGAVEGAKEKMRDR